MSVNCSDCLAILMGHLDSVFLLLDVDATPDIFVCFYSMQAAGCSRGHFSFAKGEVVREDQWEWPAVVDAEAFRMKKQARRRWGHFRSTGPSAAILLGLALCSKSTHSSVHDLPGFITNARQTMWVSYPISE